MLLRMLHHGLSGYEHRQKKRELQQQKHAPLSDFCLSYPMHQCLPHAKTGNGLPEKSIRRGKADQAKAKRTAPLSIGLTEEMSALPYAG